MTWRAISGRTDHERGDLGGVVVDGGGGGGGGGGDVDAAQVGGVPQAGCERVGQSQQAPPRRRGCGYNPNAMNGSSPCAGGPGI